MKFTKNQKDHRLKILSNIVDINLKNSLNKALFAHMFDNIEQHRQTSLGYFSLDLGFHFDLQ